MPVALADVGENGCSCSAGLGPSKVRRVRFKVPRVDSMATRIEIDAVQLSMLLDGIDFGRIRRPDLWTPPTKNS